MSNIEITYINNVGQAYHVEMNNDYSATLAGTDDERLVVDAVESLIRGAALCLTISR